MARGCRVRRIPNRQGASISRARRRHEVLRLLGPAPHIMRPGILPATQRWRRPSRPIYGRAWPYAPLVDMKYHETMWIPPVPWCRESAWASCGPTWR